MSKKRAGAKRPAPASARPKIDPRLQAALKGAGDDTPIDAVIMFRDSGKPAAAGESGPEKAVADLARSEAIEYNFFPNLGAVAVRASKQALQKLLRHPDVTTATVSQ